MSQRYEGTRWTLVHGNYDGVAQFAVHELLRMVQSYMPYLVPVVSAEAERPPGHLAVIGTPSGNGLVAELVARGLITLPAEEGGYTIACLPSPWGEGATVLVVAGQDPLGVLWGVEDFCATHARWISVPKCNYPKDRRQAFDLMRPFATCDYPRIPNRGIWTWGQVIYDYRRFIDHMARLRMNMLTFWNDVPPLNVREVIDYAHARGVKIVLGFHWGWGTDHDLTKQADRDAIKRDVLTRWREDYRDTGCDGIYFQTLTEHTNTELGGRSVASITCDMVNDIAGALLTEVPDLHIQWGLHAGSIVEHYTDLESLDARVSIIWEDAGVMPYTYNPTLEYDESVDAHCLASGLDSFEATLDYSKRLATFRPNRQFGMVPKGWTNLDWENEFESHGPYILGERGRDFLQRRLARIQPRWDWLNATWLKTYPMAAQFYREILDAGPADFTVTALVEDGLFEEAIQPSVALFAATVWNSHQDDREILATALSPYYVRQGA